MEIALYARVSTHDQQTLPMQLKAMREYAKKRGWKIKHEIQEIGSGAKTRPKREELLKDARRRQVDAIIVWRLDRWGRSVSDLIGTIRELTDIGVGFVSLTEALDLTTPAGKAMLECWRFSRSLNVTSYASASKPELLTPASRAKCTADQ